MKQLSRTKKGLAGSLGFHIALFFVLAITGLFHQVHHQQDVVEVVAMDEGGGGGYSGGSGGDVVSAESAPVQSFLSQVATMADDIATEQRAQPQQTVQQAVPETNPSLPAAPASSGGDSTAESGGSASGNGEGAGLGSGYGEGTGDGNGYGEGSGSSEGTGYGEGSGEDTGSGEGGGDSDEITYSPAVPPQVISRVRPQYPASLQRANITGVVQVRLLIGRDGSVEEATVVGSSGYRAMDYAAAEACRQWTFTSAQNSAGRPVRCYWEVPVRFSLT